MVSMKDLIERITDPDNRRRNILKVSTHGKKEASKVDPIIEKYRSHAIRNISEKELAICESTLEKIFHNLKYVAEDQL